MGGRLISSFTLAGAILATAPCALAATEYDVIDIPQMTASNGQTYAHALNNLGQVVGGYSHVLLYSGGTTQELDFQTIGIPTVGTGINDSGQIVGYGFSGQPGPAGQASQAFFYSNGTATNLASLLPYPGASWAHSVNVSGEAVVENYETVNGGPDHLLTYQNGIVTDLHVTGFSPTIINDLGHIAGTVNQRATFYDGQVHDLGTPAGDVSVASGMNNSDQIVGYIRDGSTGAASAYLYSNGAITELGTLHGDNSYAYAINNLGQIVGSSDSNVVLGGAFIDSNDQMTDLNTLIAPGGNPQGLHIDDAFGISDSGYILGTGSTLGPSPTYETVLLVPATPEPGACAIALLAAAGLLRRGETARHFSVAGSGQTADRSASASAGSIPRMLQSGPFTSAHQRGKRFVDVSAGFAQAGADRRNSELIPLLAANQHHWSPIRNHFDSLTISCRRR